MTAADASTIETAVVVVGGGDAGLAAAIEARALGCDVVLMEKDAELGGSTGRSIGSITSSQTPHQLRHNIEDSWQEHWRTCRCSRAISRRATTTNCEKSCARTSPTPSAVELAGCRLRPT